MREGTTNVDVLSRTLLKPSSVGVPRWDFAMGVSRIQNIPRLLVALAPSPKTTCSS